MSFKLTLDTSEKNVFITGIIGIICHPLYWFLWTYIDPQKFENPLLRLIGVITCIPLVLYKYWPSNVKQYFSWYTFFTALFNLPFFFTFYLISSNFSPLWSMAEVMMIFFLIILIPNFIPFIINFLAGITLSIFLALKILEPECINSHDILCTYIPAIFFAIIIAFFFSKRMVLKIVIDEKRSFAESLSSSMHHEIKNYLNNFTLVLENFGNLLSQGKDSDIAIKAEEVSGLLKIYDAGLNSIKSANQSIDLMLNNMSHKKIKKSSLKPLSIKYLIDKAVTEYSYKNELEKQAVRLNLNDDFIVYADENLIMFVLFNLMKNGLYYLKLNPACTISIKTEIGSNFNKVIAHDTGNGIPNSKIDSIFKGFNNFGKTEGVGLGLAFCAETMKAFGGNIKCQSEFEKYSTFILEFPKNIR